MTGTSFLAAAKSAACEAGLARLLAGLTHIMLEGGGLHPCRQVIRGHVHREQQP